MVSKEDGLVDLISAPLFWTYFYGPFFDFISFHFYSLFFILYCSFLFHTVVQ